MNFGRHDGTFEHLSYLVDYLYKGPSSDRFKLWKSKPKSKKADWICIVSQAGDFVARPAILGRQELSGRGWKAARRGWWRTIGVLHVAGVRSIKLICALHDWWMIKLI